MTDKIIHFSNWLDESLIRCAIFNFIYVEIIFMIAGYFANFTLTYYILLTGIILFSTIGSYTIMSLINKHNKKRR